MVQLTNSEPSAQYFDWIFYVVIDSNERPDRALSQTKLAVRRTSNEIVR